MFEDQGFTVIPNVIQTEKYRFDPTMRKSVRQKMNATDKFVVGTVGRLAEQKNPFFAIDVFKCLLKKMFRMQNTGGLEMGHLRNG